MMRMQMWVLKRCHDEEEEPQQEPWSENKKTNRPAREDTKKKRKIKKSHQALQTSCLQFESINYG